MLNACCDFKVWVAKHFTWPHQPEGSLSISNRLTVILKGGFIPLRSHWFLFVLYRSLNGLSFYAGLEFSGDLIFVSVRRPSHATDPDTIAVATSEAIASPIIKIALLQCDFNSKRHPIDSRCWDSHCHSQRLTSSVLVDEDTRRTTSEWWCTVDRDRQET